MIRPEVKTILEDLGRNQFGKALREYLQEEMGELSDISKAKSWEETQGRQIALKTIKKLFAFLEEKKAVKKTKNPYE